MAWKDIGPGDKIAKMKGARFIKSSKGTLGVEVEFEFEDAQGPERLSWQGWLSPAAVDRTMETLTQVLGYNGTEETDANGVIQGRDAFAYDRDVKLVVELETNPESGKSYPKIKWVNSIGGSQYAGIEVKSVKAELNQIGFRAAFLKSKKGIATNEAPKLNTNEKIPF